MHKSEAYIKKNFLIGDNLSAAVISTTKLDNINSQTLCNHLYHDAASYLYSAIISIGDAMHGIKNNYYSWASVKLYYSVFYAIRAILSTKKTCLFYIGTKPYSIHVSNGESARKENGTTHKVIYTIYERLYPNDPVFTQLIDMSKPLNWLMNQRENSNYKNARFLEPETPEIYKKIIINMRNNIEGYIKNENYLYTFDKDHSILSLPIHIVIEAIDAYSSLMTSHITADEATFLSSLFNEIDGAYSLQEKIRSLSHGKN